MHCAELPKKKLFRAACSLLPSLLSFDLLALTYRMTDPSNVSAPAFYFHVPGQTDLDEDLLKESGFAAHITTIEPEQRVDQDVFSLSGISTLFENRLFEDRDQAPEERRSELTRAFLPALQMIRSTLQHPDFRRALDTAPEQGQPTMEVHLTIPGNSDLMASMNAISIILDHLQENYMISGWHPQLPYFNFGVEAIMPITLFQGEQVTEASVEAGSPESLSEPSFTHRQSILQALEDYIRIHTPTRRTEDNLYLRRPQTYDLSLHIAGQFNMNLLAGTSLSFEQALRERRILSPSPGEFLHLMPGPVQARFFILRVETTPESGWELPTSARLAIIELYFYLIRTSFPSFWRYQYLQAEQIQNTGRIALSFMFEYFMAESRQGVSSQIDLQTLRSEFSEVYSPGETTMRFAHWEPMRILYGPLSLQSGSSTPSEQNERADSFTSGERNERRGRLNFLRRIFCFGTPLPNDEGQIPIMMRRDRRNAVGSFSQVDLPSSSSKH